MGGAGAPLPLSGPLLPLLLLLLAAGRVRGAAGGLADSVVWAVNAGGDAHVDVNGIHFRKDPLEGRVGRGEGTGGGEPGRRDPGGGALPAGLVPARCGCGARPGTGGSRGCSRAPPGTLRCPLWVQPPAGPGTRRGLQPSGPCLLPGVFLHLGPAPAWALCAGHGSAPLSRPEHAPCCGAQLTATALRRGRRLFLSRYPRGYSRALFTLRLPSDRS